MIQSKNDCEAVFFRNLILKTHLLTYKILYNIFFFGHEGCSNGWIGGYERNCYKIISTVETWDKADGTCKELGAKLVTLDTPQKTAFVVEALIKGSIFQAHL